MEVTLIVTCGPSQGRAIPLPATVFTIGRARRCHLRPHSLAVSKLHCAIACWAGKVVVRDLHSVNGTYLNGQPVHGEARLHDGDTLEVGPLGFVCRIRELPDEPAVPIVRKAELKWLIDSPPGSGSLEVSQTYLGPAKGRRPGSDGEVLSAGEYLRDYFRKPHH